MNQLFEVLPEEINFEILSHLPIIDLLFSISQVCKQWRRQALPLIMKSFNEFKSTTRLSTPSSQTIHKLSTVESLEINSDHIDDDFYETFFKKVDGRRFIRIMLRKFIYQVADRWIESRLELDLNGIIDFTNDPKMMSDLDLITNYFSYFSDLQSEKKEEKIVEKIEIGNKGKTISCGNSVFTGIFQFLTSFFGSTQNQSTSTTTGKSMDIYKHNHIPIKFGNDKFSFKCTMCGDSNSGKSSFINCIVYNQTFDKYIDIPTIGSFFNKNYKFSQDTQYDLQIWDVYGPERYRPITMMQYRRVHVVFLFFDLTDRQSFEHVPLWYEELKKYDAHHSEVILIGNKSDLEKKICVKKEEAQNLAFEKMNGSLYIESTNSDIKHAHKIAVYSILVKYCIMRNLQPNIIELDL